MNRAEMIDLLIDCDMNPEDYALDPQDQADTFAHYLRRGFPGYESMTDEELAQLVEERELLQFSEVLR